MSGEQSESILDMVEQGQFPLVYASPESMLGIERWRVMLASRQYRHLIGVAVDEAHCIPQ